jgi:hypothetical protein
LTSNEQSAKDATLFLFLAKRQKLLWTNLPSNVDSSKDLPQLAYNVDFKSLFLSIVRKSLMTKN